MDKQSSYARTRERLEEIVAQVKAKDISLEKSLDLYEEALRLGTVCAEKIDRTDFSVEELEAASADVGAGANGDVDAGVGDADAGADAGADDSDSADVGDIDDIDDVAGDIETDDIDTDDDGSVEGQ
jgi:exodeoxyribonuclease VII small subunit